MPQVSYTTHFLSLQFQKASNKTPKASQDDAAKSKLTVDKNIPARGDLKARVQY